MGFFFISKIMVVSYGCEFLLLLLLLLLHFGDLEGLGRACGLLPVLVLSSSTWVALGLVIMEEMNEGVH